MSCSCLSHDCAFLRPQEQIMRPFLTSPDPSAQSQANSEDDHAAEYHLVLGLMKRFSSCLPYCQVNKVAGEMVTLAGVLPTACNAHPQEPSGNFVPRAWQVLQALHSWQIEAS